jgi:hypothetical protein
MIKFAKYLKNSDKNDLIEDLKYLYNNFPAIKEFYMSRLDTNGRKRLFGKYRDIIKKEFFPDSGDGKCRLSVAKKAIKDYKKITNDLVGVIKLMLVYVDLGVNYTQEYGDINENFYHSIHSTYLDLLELIFKHDFENEYRQSCLKVAENSEGIGWGFHDAMMDTYFDFYNP